MERQKRTGRTGTGFPFWVEEKARIRAFFLSRSALSLFFALFILRAFALFFSLRARERESAKKAPTPTSGVHTGSQY
jgi:hypothetical protein